jgi:hypothetical protein
MREGNILILALKASPIGLKAKTTWRFYLTFSKLTMNQSMVQQLIREGNILILALKASPIGLKAKTTWRFRLTRSMNMLYIFKGVISICRFNCCPLICI